MGYGKADIIEIVTHAKKRPVFTVAVAPDPIEGAWTRNGIRVGLHFFSKLDTGGIILRNSIRPIDLINQPFWDSLEGLGLKPFALPVV